MKMGQFILWTAMVLMQRMSGKLPGECPIIWMEKAIWQRIPGSMELTMPEKMAA